MQKFLQILLFILISYFSPLNAKEILIGTGSKNAMFYPFGSAICEQLNKDPNYQCKALVSKGAANNLQNLSAGKIDLAISQAPLQYEYYQKDNRIRTVLKLHDESFTIVARKGSNINNFSDLLGKKVNIGNHGSGSRIFFDRIIAANNWQYSDFAKVYEKASSKIPELFCNGTIDAAIYLVGHPNKIFEKILSECSGELISLSNDEIKKFKKVSSAFINTKIFKESYVTLEENIKTIGVPIILSSLDDADPGAISHLADHAQTIILKTNSINIKADTPDINLKTAPLHDSVLDSLMCAEPVS